MFSSVITFYFGVLSSIILSKTKLHKVYLILGGHLIGVKTIHWLGNHEVLFTIFTDNVNYVSLGLC